VVSRAKGAFPGPGDDGGDGRELAELVYDSLAAGATTPDRFWLVFQHERAQLQLAITRGDDGWNLRGRLDPPWELRAELEIDPGEVALVVPAPRGELVFASVAPGRMRLVLVGTDPAPTIETDWFVLGARQLL
jgi:hypothetical protein